MFIVNTIYICKSFEVVVHECLEQGLYTQTVCSPNS